MTNQLYPPPSAPALEEMSINVTYNPQTPLPEKTKVSNNKPDAIAPRDTKYVSYNPQNAIPTPIYNPYCSHPQIIYIKDNMCHYQNDRATVNYDKCHTKYRKHHEHCNDTYHDDCCACTIVYTLIYFSKF